ncbi:MAG TPA: prephenate dehydrogenase/arogenate dehydrogenase family protein [Candidatus Omnitrophota bacterium]|nr:prephenate dehydrogenase/arogenate dehydrogenase family protein [Candidatus Omnitrophota bacterium]
MMDIMNLRSSLFRRVTIIGVGLMGGSLGLSLKKHQIAKEIVGCSHRQSSLQQALEQKAIDIAETDVSKAVRNADLIVLAAPVEGIIQSMAIMAPHIRRHMIITDMGSTKAEIVEAARKSLPNNPMFVGSHPLVGSEQSGVRGARDNMFEGALCIMTPTEQTNQVAKEKVKLMWQQLGAKVQFMPATEHDETLAHISHLPHLLAYGLIETIPSQYLSIAPQSLLDTTRVASSSPQMWNDICMTNPKNILKALDAFINNLSSMRKSIVARDQKNLTFQFSKAKEKRDGIKTNGTAA